MNKLTRICLLAGLLGAISLTHIMPMDTNFKNFEAFEPQEFFDQDNNEDTENKLVEMENKAKDLKDFIAKLQEALKKSKKEDKCITIQSANQDYESDEDCEETYNKEDVIQFLDAQTPPSTFNWKQAGLVAGGSLAVGALSVYLMMRNKKPSFAAPSLNTTDKNNILNTAANLLPADEILTF